MRRVGSAVSPKALTLKSCSHRGGTAASTVISRSRRFATSCCGSGERSIPSAAPVPTAQRTWLIPYTKLKGRMLATRSSDRIPRYAMTAVTAYLGIRSDDRVASILPFSFVYGMSQVLCAVGTGAALGIERSPLPQQLVANLREREMTVLAAVPPLWLQLLSVSAFGDTALPTLRILTNAGGHLPVERVRALRQAQPQAQLYLMYGLTEVLRSTYLPPEEVDRRPGSMGRAIPGAEVLVLREGLTPCAAGEVGELVHAGPTVALGYWQDPEGTTRTFRPHPLRPSSMGARVVFSGDLVRQDDAGFLYYVCRRDRLIKSLGD